MTNRAASGYDVCMKPILVLMAPGFEEIELTAPIDILRRLEIPVVTAGASTAALYDAVWHGFRKVARRLMAGKHIKIFEYSDICHSGNDGYAIYCYQRKKTDRRIRYGHF